MNMELPMNCIGFVLKYRNGLTMEVIKCNDTNILCRFPDGAQHCFKRGGFSESDIVSRPTNPIINEPTLF